MSRGAAIRARYSALGRALSACQGDPALELGVVVRAVLEQTHPSLGSRDAADLVRSACERALSRGVSQGLVDEIVTAPETAQYAASRIETLKVVPLSARSDEWVRLWCNRAPRVLLLAAPGLGNEAYGRAYTAAELYGVSHWRVSAECERMSRWWEFAAWCGSLYREYTRRSGKKHACEVRVTWLRLAVEPKHFAPSAA